MSDDDFFTAQRTEWADLSEASVDLDNPEPVASVSGVLPLLKRHRPPPPSPRGRAPNIVCGSRASSILLPAAAGAQ